MTKTKPPKGYIGRALKRVEDPRLIQGRATYVDDLVLPGMLHLVVLRSPYAHARINSLKTDAAKAVPGVVAVFTGDLINDACGLVPCASLAPDQKAPKHTCLASSRVYFVGHPVAVVVASDRSIARDALDLIEVDYDPMPVVASHQSRTTAAIAPAPARWRVTREGESRSAKSDAFDTDSAAIYLGAAVASAG